MKGSKHISPRYSVDHANINVKNPLVNKNQLKVRSKFELGTDKEQGLSDEE